MGEPLLARRALCHAARADDGHNPHGDRIFDISFDFIAHELHIRTSDGAERRIKLHAQSVAQFHKSVMDALRALSVPVVINDHPNEIPNATPFTQDHAVRPYDEVYAHRFWRALVQADRIFQKFRTSFVGKNSPVHFFWGSFDLAVTRFSGRTAPLHPGGVPALPDAVTREAYSHEVSSAGFWPGSPNFTQAAFYSYAYPEPPGFRDAVSPAGAFYSDELREFILPYETVRKSSDPDRMLRDFLYSTYEAAAIAAHWDRAQLECREGRACIPRPV